ncbi:DUF4190 domain-containing protein [Streptomyces xanthophaeus]|uniref:DUF4190 domain-containing protein n=1 Tax=Streptomyces xanthophaeus TaxID=67385 RepID=UPI003661D715
MTENSPGQRDPWAPPERPATDLGKPQGTPGVSGPPSVHDQPTLAGGEDLAGPPPAAPQQIPGPASAAYGYPAQPDPGGYGYPGPPPAPTGYGFPGDAGYPGPPGYPGQQAYGGYPYGGRQLSNGFGITALVLGILAVVAAFGCITAFLAVPIGIGAVVYGVLGRGKAARGEADNGGMALAGLITGSVGIGLGALITTLMFSGFWLDSWDDDPEFDDRSPYSNSQAREKA